LRIYRIIVAIIPIVWDKVRTCFQERFQVGFLQAIHESQEASPNPQAEFQFILQFSLKEQKINGKRDVSSSINIMPKKQDEWKRAVADELVKHAINNDNITMKFSSA